jgi:hypothetical protein
MLLQQQIAGLLPQLAAKSEELRMMQREKEDIDETVQELVRTKNSEFVFRVYEVNAKIISKQS